MKFGLTVIWVFMQQIYTHSKMGAIRFACVDPSKKFWFSDKGEKLGSSVSYGHISNCTLWFYFWKIVRHISLYSLRYTIFL